MMLNIEDPKPKRPAWRKTGLNYWDKGMKSVKNQGYTEDTFAVWIWILMDIGYLLILLIYSSGTGFQYSFAVFRFRLLFTFVPFCGSKYCGLIEVFFRAKQQR